MRIRKRQVPFPLSSLSPVPLSDLDLRRSPELPLADGAAADQPNRRAPDPTPTIGLGNNAATVAEGHNEREKPPRPELRAGDTKWTEYEVPETHDFRKESILGAAAETPPGNFSSPMSLSNEEKERRWWCQAGDDKTVPLKKRRGNGSSGGFTVNTSVVQTKFVTQQSPRNVMRAKNGSQACVSDDSKRGKFGAIEERLQSDRKCGRRGVVAMQGSRCSRVNGRGWRCCQRTLVGYSLCEHHLGKSRLQSISTVRSRASALSRIKTSHAVTAPDKQKNTYDANDDNHLMSDILNDDDNDEDNGKEPVKDRRMRIGTVKARSLSSLLGEDAVANNK